MHGSPPPLGRTPIPAQEEGWEERPAALHLLVPTTKSLPWVLLSLRMVGNIDGRFGALFLPEHIMYLFIF